jgi:hypothetical protein
MQYKVSKGNLILFQQRHLKSVKAIQVSGNSFEAAHAGQGSSMPAKMQHKSAKAA